MKEPGDAPGEAAALIARLEGRVAALEAALERRSHDLLLMQRHLCHRDLVLLDRLAAGLPPLPRGAYQPETWQETIALTRAGVAETLAELWQSLGEERRP